MTYPHDYIASDPPAFPGWSYVCACGEGSTFGGEDGDNCPAALRQHIADLSRLRASIHKAVAAERAAIVAWLRDGTERMWTRATDRSTSDVDSTRIHSIRYHLCELTDAIERGEHYPLETEK